jgi:sulfhydrogenase subunit beta (sulfur reductase)
MHPFILHTDSLASLLNALKQRGYTTVGPVRRNGAIVYDEVGSLSDFPVGWMDRQAPAKYRLEKRNDEKIFGFVVGPHSWKRYFFPPALKLFSLRKDGEETPVIESELPQSIPNYGFIGVRPCELNAILIQDKVFNNAGYADSHYASVRKNAFFVAVNCTEPGGTCFCDSMGTGPKATVGYDIVLTEVLAEGKHYFVAESGSEKGQEVLAELRPQPATNEDTEAVNNAIECARHAMGRVMDTADIKQLLYDNFDHPHWDDVAKRCLSCANCTLVCPTCFCSTTEDAADLTGTYAERWRKWDSCFAMSFSYIHGGSVRQSVKSRYRQWMTHKLASWIDQFGTSGCVGCGRCITWCPVGIDITQESQAIRETMKITSTSA